MHISSMNTSPVDLFRAKQARVVFAGLAPISKGTSIHIECPRVGSRLGSNPEDDSIWLTADRLQVPGVNIIHISRGDSFPVGSFHWKGRLSGIVEAVVRRCVSDGETQQTYFDIDVVAERKINRDGEITSSLPKWDS